MLIVRYRDHTRWRGVSVYPVFINSLSAVMAIANVRHSVRLDRRSLSGLAGEMAAVNEGRNSMPTDATNPPEDVPRTGIDRADATRTPFDSAQRALASCGIAAPLLIAVVVLVLAELTPNYSHVANTLSELGAVGAPYAAYFNTSFVVAGVLITAFAVGLHRGIEAGRGSRAGPGLIAVFGLFATAGAGLTPLDPEPMALINFVHLALVMAGFLGLAAGMSLLSVRMATDPDWQRYARITLLGSVGLLVLFLGWFLALFLVPLEAGEAPNGALQRPFVVWALLWIELTAIKLFRLSQ